MPAPATSPVKVPEVTLVFWALKIVATTLGETAGDAVTMSLGLGYLAGSLAFAGLFALTLAGQLRATRFRPGLYWATLAASTLLGTTMADFADRSLGIGYAGGAALLALLLALALLVWRAALGSVAVASVNRPAAEAFYWTTLMLAQTLGTALGDWTVESLGHGYAGSGLLFGGLLALLGLAYLLQPRHRTALFWAAFILTRPLGAVLGDFLDKPRSAGGLSLNRGAASAALGGLLLLGLLLGPQRAAARAH